MVTRGVQPGSYGSHGEPRRACCVARTQPTADSGLLRATTMRVVSAADVTRLLPVADAIPLMAHELRLFSAGTGIYPPFVQAQGTPIA